MFPLRERRENGERSRRLEARLLDEAGGKEGAAATNPPTGGFRDMNAIARGDQNPQRGVDLLALECRVERIGEQRDFRSRLGTIGFAVGPKESGRHAGRLRPAASPMSRSDNLARGGIRSRKFIRACRRDASPV